ncbi:MAG: arylsulfotransferase family protein, partial [Planctomycetota bacterium]
RRRRIPPGRVGNVRRSRRARVLRELRSCAGRATAASLAAVVLAACSDAPPARTEEVPPHPTRSVRDLAALGYAQWDDTADEARDTVVHDPDRVHPGPRAWADDRSTLRVIDVDGRTLRTIEVPGREQVEFARFLPGGRIACVGVDEGLTLLEADGSVAWNLDVACHHEVAVVPDGSAAGERTFALAVHGARPWRGRSVRFDEVLFVDEATGAPSEAIERWSTFEHRAELLERAGGPHPLDDPPTEAAEARTTGTTYDYFHLNSIAFDGPGSMLVCLRNVDLVVRVDLATRALGPGLGPGVLDWPHAPSVIERDGRSAVLVFDNGYHRGWSRAVELDPRTGEVIWEYRGTPDRPLFSRVRGYVERLPNGNSLVTESQRGRVLEVTDAGEVVWEHWNPELRETAVGLSRRRIYRMTALPRAPDLRSGTGGR